MGSWHRLGEPRGQIGSSTLALVSRQKAEKRIVALTSSQKAEKRIADLMRKSKVKKSKDGKKEINNK